jgi:hypothetical protein
MIEISTGVSRKLNHAQYGGAAYESSDIWLSYKQEIEVPDEENAKEFIEKATTQIHYSAEEALQKMITEKITMIKNN